ncbi:MAG TPA: sigma-70 family RNA polymerase sigma factor [Thermoanaerobaculia bacterium]|nr:sigma-70 family RNA polymerase sigma factor [Thermoanaerobaculia bacterium]
MSAFEAPCPDADLARRARAGDAWAFEQLVRRHAAMAIGAAARVTRDAGLAEDAAQEAFWKAYRALPSYREEQNFGGWLRRITVRCALDILRRRRPETALSGFERAPGGEERAIEVRNRLAHALARIGAMDREILLSVKAEGRAVAEVAAELGITAVSARVRLHRARMKLKKILMEEP